MKQAMRVLVPLERIIVSHESLSNENVFTMSLNISNHISNCLQTRITKPTSAQKTWALNWLTTSVAVVFLVGDGVHRWPLILSQHLSKLDLVIAFSFPNGITINTLPLCL